MPPTDPGRVTALATLLRRTRTLRDYFTNRDSVLYDQLAKELLEDSPPVYVASVNGGTHQFRLGFVPSSEPMRTASELADAREAAAAAPLMVVRPARTDREIVQQTRDLAREFLADRGHTVPEGFEWLDLRDPHVARAWRLAVLAQERLTDTDVNDAIANCEGDEPGPLLDGPPAEPKVAAAAEAPPADTLAARFSEAVAKGNLSQSMLAEVQTALDLAPPANPALDRLQASRPITPWGKPFVLRNTVEQGGGGAVVVPFADEAALGKVMTLLSPATSVTGGEPVEAVTVYPADAPLIDRLRDHLKLKWSVKMKPRLPACVAVPVDLLVKAIGALEDMAGWEPPQRPLTDRERRELEDVFARRLALAGFASGNGRARGAPLGDGWTLDEWDRRILDCIPSKAASACLDLAAELLAVLEVRDHGAPAATSATEGLKGQLEALGYKFVQTRDSWQWSVPAGGSAQFGQYTNLGTLEQALQSAWEHWLNAGKPL